MAGKKDDKDKLEWHLLPWKVLEEVVQIMMFGKKKYGENNWQEVKNGKERYFNAAIRHLIAWHKGEILDKESGLSHLSHALCCVLFCRWIEMYKHLYMDLSKWRFFTGHEEAKEKSIADMFNNIPEIKWPNKKEKK